MSYADEIKRTMDEANYNSVCFIYSKSQPSIQFRGIRYVILEIHAPEDGRMELSVRPSYAWRLSHITVDDTFRESTWRRLTNIVKREVERLSGSN